MLLFSWTNICSTSDEFTHLYNVRLEPSDQSPTFLAPYSLAPLRLRSRRLQALDRDSTVHVRHRTPRLETRQLQVKPKPWVAGSFARNRVPVDAAGLVSGAARSIYVCIYVRMFGCMHVCQCVCLLICLYKRVDICAHRHTSQYF